MPLNDILALQSIPFLIWSECHQKEGRTYLTLWVCLKKAAFLKASKSSNTFPVFLFGFRLCLVFTIVRDTLGIQVHVAGASVKLGHGALFLHLKRVAVTTCFTEIIYWKEDVKLQRCHAFSNRKDPWGGGCRETWKRNNDSHSLNHILEYNESDGIWQGFMLIRRSWALSVLSWSDPASLFLIHLTNHLVVLLGVNFFSFPVSIDSFLCCLLVNYFFAWTLGPGQAWMIKSRVRTTILM